MGHPQVESTDGNVPCAREAPGAMLSYRGRVYMFGGGTLRYGASSGQGNKSTLGGLNDVWVYDPSVEKWDLLEENDGAAGFDVSADRPCARMLPAWVEIDGRFYLFGGLSILSEGWKFTLLNDLWRYDPSEARWTLLEPDDGVLLEHPDCAGLGRPTTIGGFGTAVIGSRIYLFVRRLGPPGTAAADGRNRGTEPATLDVRYGRGDMGADRSGRWRAVAAETVRDVDDGMAGPDLHLGRAGYAGPRSAVL